LDKTRKDQSTYEVPKSAGRPAAVITLGAAALGLLVALALVAGPLGGWMVLDSSAASSRIGANAFASVKANGQLLQSRNVRKVTRENQGEYCLDSAVKVKNVVASPSAAAAAAIVTGSAVAIDGNPLGCPAGTDAFVVTVSLTGDLEDAPFYVVMF